MVGAPLVLRKICLWNWALALTGQEESEDDEEDDDLFESCETDSNLTNKNASTSKTGCFPALNLKKKIANLKCSKKSVSPLLPAASQNLQGVTEVAFVSSLSLQLDSHPIDQASML